MNASSQLAVQNVQCKKNQINFQNTFIYVLKGKRHVIKKKGRRGLYARQQFLNM